MRRRISSLVSGPRKYESTQRVSSSIGSSSCTFCMRKTRLFRPESLQVDRAPVEARTGVRRGEAVEHPGLVALGREPAEEPGAGVRERLVVEIHGVLRRRHHAQAEGAGLLEQREERLLRRWVGSRRQIAEGLVEIEDGAQARGPGLAPHPGEHFVQDEGHGEHPLAIREMGEGDDRDPRPPVRGPQEASRVERFPLKPGAGARRGEEPVQRRASSVRSRAG